MSATAPWWVSLATAALGLVAGLAAAAWTQRRADRREDVRWERERDDRQDQWRREDSQRWLQHRQQAYARLIAALYEWDAVLRSAGASRKNDAALNERTELDTDALSAASRAAREALPLVQFMAPQAVRSLAGSAVRDREVFRIFYLTPDDPPEAPDFAEMDTWLSGHAKRTASLHEAMRADLGLGSEDAATEQ